MRVNEKTFADHRGDLSVEITWLTWLRFSGWVLAISTFTVAIHFIAEYSFTPYRWIDGIIVVVFGICIGISVLSFEPSYRNRR